MILGIIAIWINIVFVFALKTFLDFLSVASHILPSLASFYPGFIKCTFSPHTQYVMVLIFRVLLKNIFHSFFLQSMILYFRFLSIWRSIWRGSGDLLCLGNSAILQYFKFCRASYNMTLFLVEKFFLIKKGLAKKRPVS